MRDEFIMKNKIHKKVDKFHLGKNLLQYGMLFWCIPVFSLPEINMWGVGGDGGVGVGLCVMCSFLCSFTYAYKYEKELKNKITTIHVQ